MLLPRQASGPIVAPWVQEGAPISVISDGLDAATLPAPKKLGVIVVATRELLRKPFAQQVFDALLRESAARSLDSAYFATTDPGAAGFPGLLFDAVDLGVFTDIAESFDGARRGLSVPGSRPAAKKWQ